VHAIFDTVITPGLKKVGASLADVTMCRFVTRSTLSCFVIDPRCVPQRQPRRRRESMMLRDVYSQIRTRAENEEVKAQVCYTGV
jgi:hypothetical protein